jgi:hypothetical protein
MGKLRVQENHLSIEERQGKIKTVGSIGRLLEEG